MELYSDQKHRLKTAATLGSDIPMTNLQLTGVLLGSPNNTEFQTAGSDVPMANGDPQVTQPQPAPPTATPAPLAPPNPARWPRPPPRSAWSPTIIRQPQPCKCIANWFNIRRRPVRHAT